MKYVCGFEKGDITIQAHCQGWTGRDCEAVQLQQNPDSKRYGWCIFPSFQNLEHPEEGHEGIVVGVVVLERLMLFLHSTAREDLLGREPGPKLNLALVGVRCWLWDFRCDLHTHTHTPSKNKLNVPETNVSQYLGLLLHSRSYCVPYVTCWHLPGTVFKIRCSDV